MAKISIWNIGKANAEISAADAAINPLLESAKITTIKVDGKDLPASDAPLADKISALAAVSKPGVANQDISELVTSNDLISKQLEDATGKLAVSNSSVAKLQQDNAALTSQLQTSQSSVSNLTAANAELQNRHDASIRQVGELTKQVNGINAEVSKQCLEYGCLDLTTEDGKLLAKDASADEKLAAANRIPIADKLKASKGATNAAMAKLGLPVGDLPAPGMPHKAGSEKKDPKGRDRMKAAMKIEGATV